MQRSRGEGKKKKAAGKWVYTDVTGFWLYAKRLQVSQNNAALLVNTCLFKWYSCMNIGTEPLLAEWDEVLL